MMRLKSVDYVAEAIGIASMDVLRWCQVNGVPRFYDGTRWVVDFGKAIEVAERTIQSDDGLASAVKGHIFEGGPKTKMELSRDLACSAEQADRVARRLEAEGVLIKRNSYWMWSPAAVEPKQDLHEKATEPAGAMPPVPTSSRKFRRWELIEDEMILISTRGNADLAKIMGRTAKAIGSRRAVYRRGLLVKDW